MLVISNKQDRVRLSHNRDDKNNTSKDDQPQAKGLNIVSKNLN